MRGCSVFEGVHQEAKLLLRTLGGEAQYLENLCLKHGIMDSDAAAADFNAVANHVVGICQDACGVCVQLGDVAGLRRGEGMVHGHQATFFFAPFKHGEVDNPKQGELVFVAESQTATHFQTQLAKLLARFHGVVARENQQQIAGFCRHLVGHSLKRGLLIEFVDRTLDGSVFIDTCINEALCTNLRGFNEISQLVELLARIAGTSFCTDTADVCGIVKYTEKP